MKTSILFAIDSYLQPNEAFHFVRKQLEIGAPSPLHHHDYYELFLVEEGRARHWINGRLEPLSVGDLVFIRPQDTHRFEPDPSLGFRILNTMFRCESADHLLARYRADLAGRFFWSSDPAPVTMHLEGPVLERVTNTTLTLSASQRTLVRIESYLMALMTSALDEMPDVPRAAPGWLVDACHAVARPDVFRQGVSGFFAAAARGQEHVCRQTRRFLGVTPTQYVNRIRIQHAAMLLGSTTVPLEQVALDCGFENMSYFHRLFKEHYGATPKDYRRRHRRDPIQPGSSLR